MDNVYVVWYGDYENTDVIAAFPTWNEACAFCDTLENQDDTPYADEDLRVDSLPFSATVAAALARYTNGDEGFSV